MGHSVSNIAHSFMGTKLLSFPQAKSVTHIKMLHWAKLGTHPCRDCATERSHQPIATWFHCCLPRKASGVFLIDKCSVVRTHRHIVVFFLSISFRPRAVTHMHAFGCGAVVGVLYLVGIIWLTRSRILVFRLDQQICRALRRFPNPRNHRCLQV